MFRRPYETNTHAIRLFPGSPAFQGPDRQTFYQTSTQRGRFHFIVNYVNFTNKPNTARNTEQIKC